MSSLLTKHWQEYQCLKKKVKKCCLNVNTQICEPQCPWEKIIRKHSYNCIVVIIITPFGYDILSEWDWVFQDFSVRCISEFMFWTVKLPKFLEFFSTDNNFLIAFLYWHNFLIALTDLKCEIHFLFFNRGAQSENWRVFSNLIITQCG